MFSGIGGIELGLEWTGGFRTIWQCENNEYSRKVLKKHWASIPLYGDIKEVEWDEVERPDVICGGFPCQDISVAGKGDGIRGRKSGLWFEMWKVIGILRPRYALMENVPMLTHRGLGEVLGSLAEIGYDAEWTMLRASDFGAPHKRERIFVIAYPNGKGEPIESINDKKRQGFMGETIANTNTRHDINERTKIQTRRNSTDISNKEMADTEGEQGSCKDIRKSSTPEQVKSGRGSRKGNVPNPDNTKATRQRKNGRKVSIFPESKGFIFSGCEEWWAVEPPVDRVVDGISSWVDRLRCLGNAVVPQVTQFIGERIIEYHKRFGGT